MCVREYAPSSLLLPYPSPPIVSALRTLCIPSILAVIHFRMILSCLLLSMPSMVRFHLHLCSTMVPWIPMIKFSCFTWLPGYRLRSSPLSALYLWILAPLLSPQSAASLRSQVSYPPPIFYTPRTTVVCCSLPPPLSSSSSGCLPPLPPLFMNPRGAPSLSPPHTVPITISVIIACTPRACSLAHPLSLSSASAACFFLTHHWAPRYSRNSSLLRASLNVLLFLLPLLLLFLLACHLWINSPASPSPLDSPLRILPPPSSLFFSPVSSLPSPPPLSHEEECESESNPNPDPNPNQAP